MARWDHKKRLLVDDGMRVGARKKERTDWWTCRDLPQHRLEAWPTSGEARTQEGCEWCSERKRCAGPVRLRVERKARVK